MDSTSTAFARMHAVALRVFSFILIACCLGVGWTTLYAATAENFSESPVSRAPMPTYFPQYLSEPDAVGEGSNSYEALLANGTLTFNSNSGLADGIATDGEGGSVDLPGIDIDIFNINDVNGTGVGRIEWRDHDFMYSNDPSYSGLTYDDGFNNGTKGMAIKSRDGSAFQIDGFTYYNWGETVATTITVRGYYNNMMVAEMNFQGYNAGYDPIQVTLNSFFDYVDEVRLFISGGGHVGNQSESNHSINNIQIADAVLPSPVVTNHPPNRTICNGGTTTLSVTATNATSYQWQENSGAGFVNLAEGGVYSGVNSATLTLTGATSAINGYQYRCRAINASGTVNSNPATMTVITISLSGSHTNVTHVGSDGTATVTASGGIGAYSYLWSPSGGTAATATGLTAGTYTVTVTDNINCSATYEFTILEPPAITNSGGAINFTENGGAVRIVASDATLTDDGDITSMTLVSDAAPNGSDETIEYDEALNGGISLASLGLTGGYNSGTRTFLVSGTAAPTVYQGVLQAMKYNNNSDGPVTTPRTVIISATNANGLTGQATVTINITAVNDVPTATNMVQSKAMIEDGPSVALDDIVVTDPDVGDVITVILTLTHPAGTLTTGTHGSATSTFNAGTGVWTVTGSVADVNAALAAVAFTPAANWDQSFSIITHIRDAAGTGPLDGSILVTVTPVNDAPTLTATAVNPVFSEGGTAVTLFSGASVSTIEPDQRISELKLMALYVTDGSSEILTVDGTEIVLTDGTAGTTTGGNAIDYTVSLSGYTAAVTLSSGSGMTAAATAGIVNGMTYRNTSIAPTAGGRALTLSGISDNGGTANGGVDATILAITTTVTVQAVNSAPAIANLNGDWVAWAGVGNAVTLDAGTNVALNDDELEAANSGNGNWAGASLTVQRAGFAVPADVLGFQISDALFTVAGGNLQAGGQTFATYTNTGGVLAITFTSSGTAATTALVNDVVRRITYRNDTPAGDATMRFSLSDGDDDAIPANVTVGSDFIYVTNYTDTYTIDVSNGVSLSEAVAIAAADGTGTQTLVFSNTLADQTITLAGNLSIGENLIFDAGAASGLTLAGSTITLGGGTTLGITNGAGNQLSMTSTIAGSGGLVKSGDGNLVLSAVNSYTGTTTVTAGMLTVTGAIAGSTVVSNGATVAGSGTFGGNVTVNNGGTLTPGSSLGILTISGNLTMATGSTLSVEINGPTAGTHYDRVAVYGTANIADAVLNVTHGYAASQGETYTIIVKNGTDAVGGTFSGLAEGGRITAGGNNTVLTGSYIGGTGNDFTLTVSDVTPPAVTAIEVSGTPSASAEAIQFTVTFNEVPANISTSDFTLTSTGTASANIASNSPVNANTVTVTIDQIAGTGTLRLDVNANSGITDTDGNGNGTNGYVAAFTGGELHTVDREPPSAPSQPELDAGSDSGVSDTDNITNDTTPTLTGTAEAGSTVMLYDTDGTTVLGVATATGGNWSITSSVLSDGEHRLTATATDAAGNTSAASTALTIQIDTQAPTVTIAVLDTELIAGETSLVTFTFSEPVLGFTHDDLNVANGILSPLGSSDGGVTWTATLTPDDGIIAATNAITLNNTGVADVAGNTGIGITHSNNYGIDNVRPTATIVVAEDELNMGETALVTITFNRGVTDLTNADLTVPNGTLSPVSTSDGGVTWTAMFTPADDTDAPTNVITLDNTGVTDAAGNAGVGISNSNSFIIRTNRVTFIVTTDSDVGDDATTATSLTADEADGGGLSLREALYWARNGDTVTFLAGISTITLGGNEVAVSQRYLTINGDLDDDGSPDVTISGNDANRVMYVAPNLSGIELIGLILTKGSASGGGGGLHIGVGSDVTLRKSSITENTEIGLGGGGVYGTSAVLTLINSTVAENSSSAFGGGIRIVGANGTLHVINSTVSGNTTTGGSQHGGGIQYGGTGGLTIVNSTISGNAVLGNGSLGGGLRITSGIAYVYNTTIVGNASTDQGGGVHANGTDTFVNTVVAGNTSGAGAVAAVDGSPLATGGTADDVGGTLERATNSYFGSNITITTDINSLNNQGTANLLLGNLMDNGGLVHTHKPQPGSVLIGAGSIADLPADAYDLDGDGDTGETLPVDATGGLRAPNGTVDIGAVEAFQGPVVTGLGTTNPDGRYKIGDEISLTVSFTNNVLVDETGGSPILLLETGDTDREAVYMSGSGTSVLVFSYTVQAGDVSDDLDYASTAALALNGSTIRNGTGEDAVLTLPAVGSAGSIAGQHDIVVDGVTPEVTSVDVPADGYYVEDDALEFTVNFGEQVTVDETGGTPYLEVTIGTTVVEAAYVGGSGSSALEFRYTVQADEVDLDGIAVGGGLVLNGGTIRDAAGNDAVLVLNNMGPTDQVWVYAVQLSVTLSTTAVPPVKGSFMVNVTFSEAVTDFTLSGVNASNALPSNLQTMDNSSYTLEVTPAADGDVTIEVLADAATNRAGTGNTASNRLTLVYDGTAPAVPVGVAAESGDGQVMLEWTANADTDVVSYRVYGGVTGDPVVLLETVVAPHTTYTHTGLTNGIAYGYQISVVDEAGNESALSIAVTATPMAEQVITFEALTAQTYGDGPLVLTATSSSRLDVSYSSSDASIASVSGSELTIHAAGRVTITASQDGDAAFHAADLVEQELTILPATLTITADDGQSKGYGSKDPVLGYSVTGFELADDESILTGALTRAPGEDVGTYAIMQGTLAAGANYTIDYVGSNFSIAPATLTVTVDASQKKVYGSEDPVLGYSVAGFELADDEGILTGALMRAPGEDVDTYAIVQGTLAAGANYTINYMGADFVITPLAVTVTANDQTKVFGQSDPELTYRVLPAPVAGDGFSGALVREPGEGVGIYRIMQGTLALGENYELTFEGAELEITPSEGLDTTLPDGSFVYDGTVKSLSVEGTLPEGTTVSYTGNSRTEVGSQQVTATVAGSNYETLVLTATLRITPGGRTLTFPVLAEKTYGDDDFDAGATASSGEAVTYTSSDPSVAEITVGGLIRIAGAGEAMITARVPENGNYADRPEISRVLVVHKASQAIKFSMPAEVNRDAGSIPLEVSTDSGLPVSLVIDDGQVAALNGTTLNILRVGTARITATQGGDANHEAAEPVTVTVRVVDPASDFPVRVHPAVSPNGDGINEFLIIEGIRDYPKNRVSVINRNGTVVWEASGYDNDRVAFRGIGTGQQQLPAGTYFYIVEIGAGSDTEYRKGYFVLRY